MDGVVALDVQAGHHLVRKLHGAVHALVPEAAAQLVYREVEILQLVRLLDVAEYVVLCRLQHRGEVRGPHVDRADGMLLVERLVGADEVHGDVCHVRGQARGHAQGRLPGVAGQVRCASYSYGYGPAPEMRLPQALGDRFGQEPHERFHVCLANEVVRCREPVADALHRVVNVPALAGSMTLTGLGSSPRANERSILPILPNLLSRK